MTEKRSQHYVPQLYLRNFSMHNNQKSIGVFNIKLKKFIQNTSIKGQASKVFFYGKDGTVEDTLSHFESGCAPVLRKIINSKQLPTRFSDEYFLIVFFLFLTELRNPATTERMMRSSALFQETVKNKLDPEFAKRLPMLTHDDALEFAFKAVELSLRTTKDLGVKLLFNSSSQQFITSDNPVAKYNQFMEAKKWIGGGWTGLASIGLQFFFPISPELCILLYDPWVYKVGDKKKDLLEVSDMVSINAINGLQFMNATDNLFFNESITESYLEYLSVKDKSFKKANQPTSKIFKLLNESGEELPGDLIVMGSSSPMMNLAISGLTFTKQAKAFRFSNSAAQWRKYPSELFKNLPARSGPYTF